jgi:alpha-1,2-mannosyltransferase
MPRRHRPVLIFLTASALLAGIYFARKSGSDPQVYGNDFNVYYFAAREVAAGRDPYQNSLGAWTTYLYPPLLAELIVPLAMLPLPAAAYLWFLINAASVAAAAWMAASLASKEGLGARDERPLIAAAAVVLIARFVLDNLHLGQVNNLVAALSVAHVFFYARRRPVASAAALALAVSIKLTPAILILYQIARLRFRFAALCIAMLALMTVASFVAFGQRAPDAFEAFVDRTIRNEQGFDLAYSGNQSLRGALLRLGVDPGVSPDREQGEGARQPVGAVMLSLAAMMLALAALTALRERAEIQAVAPFFCCMVLLSPLSWKAHFVVLILPLASLSAQALARESPHRRLTIAALAVAFLLFNLTSRLIIGETSSERADELSLVFLVALLVFLMTIRPGLFGKRGDVLLISTGRVSGDKQV